MSAADRYKGHIFLWVDTARIFAHWPDTPEGLVEAKQTMIEQWHAVRRAIPAYTPEPTIDGLQQQFFIRRARESGADEVVCTLQEALAGVDLRTVYPDLLTAE